jgi:predicted peroxiredoxin
MDKNKQNNLTDKELDKIISNGVKMYLCTAQAQEHRQFIRQNRNIIYSIMEGCIAVGIVQAIDNHIS